MEESMSGMSERTGRESHERGRLSLSLSVSDEVWIRTLPTLSEVKRSRNRLENMAFSSREVVEGLLLLYAFVRSSPPLSLKRTVLVLLVEKPLKYVRPSNVQLRSTLRRRTSQNGRRKEWRRGEFCANLEGGGSRVRN